MTLACLSRACFFFSSFSLLSVSTAGELVSTLSKGNLRDAVAVAYARGRFCQNFLRMWRILEPQAEKSLITEIFSSNPTIVKLPSWVILAFDKAYDTNDGAELSDISSSAVWSSRAAERIKCSSTCRNVSTRVGGMVGVRLFADIT